MYQKLLFATLPVLIARAAGAAPGEAKARLVESPLSNANLIDTALGLTLVLGVMLGLAWLVKRYVQVPGINRGQVQILGGVSLGAREKAVLLSVGGQRLLVGVAPGRVQTLIVLDGSQKVDDGFAAALDQVAQRDDSPVGGAS